jgi:hypothetical protein
MHNSSKDVSTEDKKQYNRSITADLRKEYLRFICFCFKAKYIITCIDNEIQIFTALSIEKKS